jgi:hypothetical protein
VASFLATQPLNASTLVVWSEAAEPEAAGGAWGGLPRSLEPYARAFPGRVWYRHLDRFAAAQGTPLAGSFRLRLRDQFAWVDSDIGRLLVLLHVGGVYIDIDMLLLRDLSPLLPLQFATEFSCSGAQAGFNNAVMHFERGGEPLRALLRRARTIFPRVRSWAFGPHLLTFTHAREAGGAADFLRLPWCFFHGLWCEGGVPRGAVHGGAPWDAAALASAFGLHLHFSNATGVRVHEGSIVAWAERWAHARVEALARRAAASAGGADDVDLALLEIRDLLHFAPNNQ